MKVFISISRKFSLINKVIVNNKRKKIELRNSHLYEIDKHLMNK